MDFKEALQLAAHIEGLRKERYEQWRELCALLMPHRGCFKGEEEKYGLRNRKIFNNHAVRALSESAAMLTSCCTPEGLDWFSHDFIDKQSGELQGAAEWLDHVDDIIGTCLKMGVFYETINACNEELLGVGCMLISAMPGRTKPLVYRYSTVGTYAVALDRDGELYAVVEHESFTARELKETFGEALLTDATRTAAAETPYKDIDVIHFTVRRTVRNPGRVDRLNKPVASYWWESGGERFLSESGYDSMPYFFCVWSKGRGIYGTGPGDLARADQRAIETMELYKSMGIEKTIDPPMLIPGGMAGKLNMNPGARNVGAMSMPDQVRPLYQIDFTRGIQEVQADIQLISQRMDETLMKTVFAVPPDELLKGMTATAVVARRRAAIQKMGPAVSRYETSVLSPLIERTFSVLWNLGFIPQPPEGLADVYTHIVYKSPLAEGLRQSDSDSLAAFLNLVQPIIQAVPEAADKIKWDEAVSLAAKAYAVDPSVLASKEEVETIRQQRAEAQQAQQEQEQQMQAMQAAAQVGGVSTNKTLAGALLAPEGEQNAIVQ